jgi:putative membrane protein
MMGFGFVVARFGIFLREFATVEKRHAADSTGFSLWLGGALIIMGVTVNIVAALEYRHFLKRYERGDTDRIPSWSLGVTTALTLAVVGLGMGAYLLMLHF